MKDNFYPEVLVEWNSSTGFVEHNYNSLLDLSNDLSKAYVRSKVCINPIY